jgi:proteasome lid subunit RPN8/RPN11
MNPKPLTITVEQWRVIQNHVERAAPLEACGLLAGKNDRVETVIPVRNQAESPVRFVMDPYEQLQAFEWIESNGLDLLGIFHSHPTGPETASPTDIAEAAYEVVQLIVSRTESGWQARGFWVELGKAVHVPVEIV